MQNASDTLLSSIKLISLLAAAALVTGCISAKSQPTDAAAAAEPAASSESTDGGTATSSDLLTSWTVVEGNHLWGISAREEVYNVPEKWPLIYKSNLDQIEDADLIYPGQVLVIPRDSTQSEIDAAINHAKTRGAWAVGPIEETDKEYLKNPG